MRCREESEAGSMIHRGTLSGRVTGLGARLGISIQVTSMDDQSVQVASIRPQCLFAPIPAA